jgi:hypothetical protein
MKYIISESQNIRIRRVYPLIREYINELLSEDICNYWDREEGPKYVAEAMSELILLIEKQYSDMTYDTIYDLLIDAKVESEITEFFYDTIDECN